MTKALVAYLATAVTMILLDLLWLGVIAKPVYQAGIGHLMGTSPKAAVALLFYAIFALGLVVFGVRPNDLAMDWRHAAAWGALFGFFAYATYDLTNFATLKDWPLGMSLLDMAWGTAVSAASASAGRFAIALWAQA